MYLDWTVTLRTDDGTLIQQIDVTAEICRYHDAGTPTGDVMVLAVYAEKRRHPLAPPRLSRITGPLADVLIESLEADRRFRDQAQAMLPRPLRRRRTGPAPP